MRDEVSEADLRLRASSTSPRAARRFVTDVLLRWACVDLVDVAQLLTSEVVTNSVLHAGSELALRVRRRAGVVRVEVTDASTAVPLLLAGDYADDAATGRGMLLVDALASTWGVDPAPEGRGKVVWFEVSR